MTGVSVVGQLNLFELPTNTVIETKEEDSIFSLALGIEHLKRSESKSIIDESLAPTWEVHYFDKAKRGRIDWIRSDSEIQAAALLREKVKDNVLFVDRVMPSKYTLEEIEMID
jgi:hypothetical protein